MLGEGSISMIVSFVALIASVAAVVFNASSKKKEALATANSAQEVDVE
jgi:hypothetical protein